MRLKKNYKRGFVGPLACVVALGFLGFSVIYPQISLVYAAESDETETKNPVEGNGQGDIKVYVKDKRGANEQAKDSNDGQIIVDVGKVNSKEDVTVTESKDITVTVEEFLQITIPNANEGATADVNMEVDPTSAGATTTASSDFIVAGNNPNGFGVFVYAASSTALVLNDKNINRTVEPIDITDADTDTGVEIDDFGLNRWGFSVTKANAADTTVNNYKPLMLRTNEKLKPAYTVTGPSAGENLKLNCGAKVDTSIPAGTYSTAVVISAVAPATNWRP